MDIRRITDTYAVAPQIRPEEAEAIRAAGFVAVICNRPDAEVPPELQSAAVRAAVERAGLRFHDNPFSHRFLTREIIAAQGAVIEDAGGPVLAYCASGNRSSILWALSQAGKRPVDELIDLPARAGFQIGQMRDQIAALAAERG